MKKYAYSFQFCNVIICADGNAVTEIRFLKKGEECTDNSQMEFRNIENKELPDIAARELKEYFEGNRKYFTFPISPSGTVFQKKVWNALLSVPYGETRSYKDIAEEIGNPRAPRAVGMANNKNPIPVVIPCHRIIGRDGSMVGYGLGIDMKEKLLKLEQQHK